MTNSRYIVHYHCQVCGRMHLVDTHLRVPGGPTEPCTVPDHYPNGNYPPSIIDSLTDFLYWCDQAHETIEFNDPTRLHLTPLSSIATGTSTKEWPRRRTQSQARTGDS